MKLKINWGKVNGTEASKLYGEIGYLQEYHLQVEKEIEKAIQKKIDDAIYKHLENNHVDEDFEKKSIIAYCDCEKRKVLEELCFLWKSKEGNEWYIMKRGNEPSKNPDCSPIKYCPFCGYILPQNF